jgi:molybdopterin synthase catalytic subunit
MCRIVRAPIDVEALAKQVAHHHNGAVVTFVGQVRKHSRGREIAYLEYDVYEPMAEKLLRELEQEARQRWGADVAVRHRVGRIELGEASVVICAGSPHRPEAFEACRWCIDTLKSSVPIWKKEVCADGAFWVEGEEQIRAVT